MIRPLALTLLFAVSLAMATPGAQAPSAQAVFERAVADFLGGRVAESVAGFDTLARLDPGRAPQLWQRGIALYYVGRYQDCRSQFESHRTVNPNDVENAAWHFLCVARADSVQRARAALLPVGPDARTPMRQVYEMFRGDLTPEAVMTAAGTRPDGQFYGHLYVGLYAEALGNTNLALEHIKAAADDRYTMGGYMHAVANLHLARPPARPVDADAGLISISSRTRSRASFCPRRPRRPGPRVGGRRGLAAVPRADRSGAFGRARPAARVERIAERRVEDAGARARLVVAGRGRRPRLADHGRQRTRGGLAARRWPSTSRPGARSSTRRCFARGTPTRSMPRTAARRRRRSSTAIASTCTSAPTARRRSTTAGEIAVEDAAAVRLAARQRRIAGRSTATC